MEFDPDKRKDQLENGLMNFRLKYLYEYYKVQLALVTGSIVILLGFHANVHNPVSTHALKISLIGLGIATVSQMLIHLNIYMRMHSIWYAVPRAERAGPTFLTLFIMNLAATILGLVSGYLFIIANI